MTIIFYRYDKGKLVENDGWHTYSRELVVDRIKRQNGRIHYKALIRESYFEQCKGVWHELDLRKSRLFRQEPKQLALFDDFF